MRSRITVLITALCLLALMPCAKVGMATLTAAQADLLSPNLESRLQAIRQLAAPGNRRGAPNPRLFSALLQFEEAIPRLPATRESQQRCRQAYLAMLSRRSLQMAGHWIVQRQRAERQIARDVQYVRQIGSVDRRLTKLAFAASQKISSFAVPRKRRLPLDELRPGDIMIWDDRSGPPVVRLAISLYASRCTHTAIYLGERSAPGRPPERWILEAQSPALGVRANLLDRRWTRSGLHVALGHVKGFTPLQGARVAEGAAAQFGTDGRTPYHIWPPWDKTYTSDGMYCSQLVWAVYAQHGVDLDSNDWRYLTWFTLHNWFNPYAAPTAYFGVFPDEIKASPHVAWYYDQANP